MSDDELCRDCTRRTVIRGIGVAAAASVLGVGCSDDGGTPVPDAGDPNAGITMCGANLCLDLNHPANEKLLAVDGTRTILIDNERTIVVRKSETAFAVLSQICTHAGCSVSFNTSLHLLVCPCHGSRFSLTGNVAQSPASRSLQTYPSTFDAATMTLTITV
jgi:Rieske Fe-S protein